MKLIASLKKAFSSKTTLNETSNLLKNSTIEDTAAAVVADTASKIISDLTNHENHNNVPAQKYSLAQEIGIVVDETITDFTGKQHENIGEGLIDCVIKVAQNPIPNLIILAGELVAETVEEAVSTRCCGGWGFF